MKVDKIVPCFGVPCHFCRKIIGERRTEESFRPKSRKAKYYHLKCAELAGYVLPELAFRGPSRGPRRLAV